MLIARNHKLNKIYYMGIERRKFPRSNLLFFARVFDQNSGELIGYLADLSHEGALIITEPAILVEKIIVLQVEIPASINSSRQLVFEAKCIRCTQDLDTLNFDSGFQILSISPEDEVLIDKILQEYSIVGS
jgi:hypothetical protein